MKLPLPPLFLIAAILLEWLLHRYYPVAEIISSAYRNVGFILIGAGIVLGVWAFAALQRHKTAVHPRGVPTALVTGGPYRISRNPMYFGALLITLGSAVAFGTFSALLVPILYLFSIQYLVIPFEEEMLRAAFQMQYQEYKKRVRRWI